jgi:predicted Fe-Mo cluster-binding NifX family protein
MKIAVVSTDGINVNDHFGKAERFLIYEKSGDDMAMVEEKETPPLSIGDKSHPFDESRFGLIAEALQGCSRIYCTRIGDRPQQELEKKGITTIIYEGAIDAITISNA